MERAERQVLESMRSEWQQELEALRRDVADRKRMLALQVRQAGGGRTGRLQG